MSSMSVSSSSSQSSGIPGVPRVGAVRCYWALLKPRYTPNPDPAITTPRLDLEFVHFDPILDAHLSKQKMSMMGRQVLEFIHPHEREQARKDLTSAISADDLQGSVTRVRFARMSRIRTILGCLPEENEFPEGMDEVFEDDMYIIEDVVLNWAKGMLLAFFHSIKDKDPVGNNDPKRAHEEWSNWCGTKYMADEQIEALYRDVLNKISIPPNTGRPPTRVFQLHLLPPDFSPETPTQLIFSWPPPRAQGSLATLDGYYNALEYCDMMKHVDMDPSQLTAGPGELRTNCTTRYGAHHLVTTEGLHRTVASVFIPYGKLIFACFQTIKEHELPIGNGNGNGNGQQGNGWGHGGLHPPTGAPSLTPSPAPTPSHLPPHPSHPAHQHTPHSHPHQHPYSHPHPNSHPHPHPHHRQHHPQDWSTDPSLLPHRQESGSSDFSDWDPHGSYGIMDSASLGQAQGNDLHLAPSNAYPTPASATSSYGYYTPTPDYGSSLSSGLGTVHPPPGAPGGQGAGPQTATADRHGSVPVGALASAPVSGSGAGESKSGKGEAGGGAGGGNGNSKASSRPLVRPPGDIECCVMCGTKESPEWRKGQTGKKDLCNACGLRLARQVAKREGRSKPRKKKEEGSSTPSKGDGGATTGTKDINGLSGRS
ncbi:hypothetical protein I350_01748 [Cryptococcus amylolentus CBS 6273]|uniref:GATA-type domain-containing protein n=1 Tax=Cryptococcus amylolentus CBS 6273 TaxID=1296118 RepID=A0A1E3KDQ9_9TREE|nr:hypothetical protein I350_01748 [Cryptococcus amylolentus CBS 6273]